MSRFLRGAHPQEIERDPDTYQRDDEQPRADEDEVLMDLGGRESTERLVESVVAQDGVVDSQTDSQAHGERRTAAIHRGQGVRLISHDARQRKSADGCLGTTDQKVGGSNPSERAA